ncbi:MAG TPA: O-antigen ligase family protein [Chitinophagaceae bacterium]|nr:O-antigen ligase family protein [Chitinophagaceae bacterium]
MIKQLFLMDAPAAVFSFRERTLYFLCLFFFLSIFLPGPSWLYNVVMWIIFVYSFFYNGLREKWQILQQRPAMQWLIIFFLYNCVSIAWSANLKESISWIGIRISLLVFPVALGSILIGARLRQRLVLGFVLSTLLGAIVCLLHALPIASVQHDASLLYNDNLSDFIHLQSIYMAMLVNLALISAAWLFIVKSPLMGRGLFIFIALLLLPVHFLLASRIAILLLYGIILLFALYMMLVKKMFRQGVLLACGLLLAAALLLLIFPKTINRFKELGYTKFNYSNTGRESHFNMALTPDQWNGANLRMAVWGCAWTVARHNFLLGTGVGDKMDELKKQYAAKGFTFGISTNRNVHNTYLDIWLSLGLLGLLLFMAGFVFSFKACITAGDWPGILILACLCISIISETYIDRTIGNTILSFFFAFIASYKKPAKEVA